MGRHANPNLTELELDVLRRFARGERTLEIAEKKSMTKRAVEHSMNMVKHKLAAATIPHAVAIASQRGMIERPTNFAFSDALIALQQEGHHQIAQRLAERWPDEKVWPGTFEEAA